MELLAYTYIKISIPPQNGGFSTYSGFFYIYFLYLKKNMRKRIISFNYLCSD
jgi:hypothetical protein